MAQIGIMNEGLTTSSNKENRFVTKAHGRYNVVKEFYEDGLIKPNQIEYIY